MVYYKGEKMEEIRGGKILEILKSRWGQTVSFLFVFFIALLFTPATARAFNPQITYQGKLTNSSGNEVSNGTYYLKATIYNALSSGTCIYTASSTTSGTCSAATSTPITVTNGIFSINLGDTSSNLNSLSSTMFTTSSLYLGITVCTGMNSGCDSEMTPRKRLTAAVYAFEADYLGGVTTSTIGGTGSYIPATDSSGNLKITNSVYIATTTAGQFGVGTTTIPSGYKAFLDSTTAADKLLVIRGNSSQSGNMLELQNNNGRALGFFDSSGYLSVGSGSVTSTLQSASLIVGQATSYNLGKFYVDGATGAMSASSSIQTFGNTTSTGIIYALGGFISNTSSSVGAGLQVAGALNASGTFQSTGLSTLIGGFVSQASSSINSLLTANSLLAQGNFNASGSVFLSGVATTTITTFAVNPTAAFLGGFIANASSSIGGGLTVNGNFSASSSITLSGSIFANNNSSNLGAFGNAFGNVYSSSTLYVGSGTSSSTFSGGLLSIGSTFDSSLLKNDTLILSYNSSRLLGKTYLDGSGNIFASGSLYTYGNVTSTGLTYNLGGIISNASSSFTNTVNISGILNASNTIYLGGSILPMATSYNLGSAAIGFGNVFVSSSVYIGNVSGASTTLRANYLAVGDGTNTTFIQSNSFKFLQATGFNEGKFSIDGSGNTSVSGTFQAFSSVTSTGIFYALSGFISNTSSSVGGLLTTNSLLSQGNFNASGSVFLSGVATTTLTTFAVNPTANLLGGFISNASSSVGAGLQVAGALNASSTLLIGGNILAGTNGSPTLGAFGTAFGNVYSSGTIYLGSGVSSSTLSGNLFSLGSGLNNTSLTPSSLTIAYNETTKSGKFNIDSSGNVSASGTFDAFGTSTFKDFTNIIGKVGNPTHTAYLADGGIAPPYLGNPYGVFVRGNFAYIPSYGSSYLEIVDVSTSSPSHRGALSLTAPSSVFVAGNYAYVTLYTTNILQIVDVSDSANPVAKGSISNGTGGASISAPTSVFVSGNYAYVTSYGGDKLEIIDISNPAVPNHKGSVSSTSAYAVYVAGKYAYVASRAGGGNLFIYDISNPSAPVLKGSLADGGASTPNLSLPTSIFVSGNYAYITADSDNALEIVDISNPTTPIHRGSITDGGGSAPYLNSTYSVFVSGKYAYVASRTSDALEVIDVSNPSSPAHKGSLTNGTGGAKLKGARGVFVSGNFAYMVADGLAGSGGQTLEIVDVSGASVSNMLIGSASIDTLQVGNFAQFNQSLLASDGLVVGGNTLLSGDVTIGGGRATTTSAGGSGLTITSTQTTTTFTSNVADSKGSGGFVFNVSGLITSTTLGTPLDRVLMAVQNGGINQFLISGGGNAYASGTFNARSSQYGIGDFAEFVDLSDGQKAEPGDVVIVDAVSLNKFRKSDTAYAKEIAGVISDTGAFVIGSGGEGRAPLAMAGLVHTKVTTENGPIKAGDYLVASSKLGFAMRYDPASGLPAGLVGMALETLESGEGKIKVLVNKGYVAGGQAGAVTLQASVVADGKLAGPVDLDLVGQRIINVKAIVSANNRWRIDENGVMINTIKTSQGTKTVYSQQSPDAEIVLSGSGQLQNGSTHVEFDQDTQDIISDQIPLKVSITLTGESEGGVFVSEKTIKGFTVKEMKNGKGNTTFDWTAIARRKGYENQPVQTSPIDTPVSAPVVSGQQAMTTPASTPALPGQQISSPTPTPAVDLPGANLSSSVLASSTTP
ncbi:MAG: hypothetical protein HY981_00780 [Candidatus Magasanikbacteria bacterium]|nr:hypothetical protein [Candidatus Magasanikbacteria bacterium]